MSDCRVVTADCLDEFRLDQFLCRVYGKTKSEFLHNYGTWWHRGNQNRLAVVRGDEIAAYCGVIPARCLIRGDEYPALWWVDLIVAPEFRGQGLQALLDRQVRQAADLTLGFPNELAAKIHRKHGWRVREDGLVMMLPLHPTGVKGVLAARGTWGLLLRSAAWMLTPAASLLRRRLDRYEVAGARSTGLPDPESWAKVFAKYRDDKIVTTCRDAEFIQWRYLDCPYRSELVFYVAGPSQSPSHLLVARRLVSQGVKTTRILDLFGDLHDTEGLRDILTLAVKDAMCQGARQVTTMISWPELRSVLRSIGFLVSVKVRFCWHSASQATMQSIARSPCYWTLADSDNDLSD